MATRRSTRRWRAWHRIFPCATCWWTARATLAQLTAMRPRPCVTPKPASHKMAEEMLADLEKRHGGFRRQLRRFAARAVGPACPPPQPAAERVIGHCGRHGNQHPTAQPSASWLRAIDYLIDNYDKMDDVTVEDLMKFVPGPDFPTGGMIVGTEGIDAGLRSPAGTDRHARHRPHRRDEGQTVTASSSPKSPTRSTSPP